MAPQRARGWRSLVDALRDPARSEFAFVPHHYVHAPAELVDVSLSPGESTPINARYVRSFAVGGVWPITFWLTMRWAAFSLCVYTQEGIW